MRTVALLILALAGCDDGPADPPVKIVPTAIAQPLPVNSPVGESFRRDVTREARAVWGLDAPVATFAGQLRQESSFRVDVVSHAGAAGLAQFMPRTATWITEMYPADLGPQAQPLNPQWAIRAMVRYDRHLWERVRSFDDECSRWKYSLSDYNGGSGWRMKRQNVSAHPGNYDITSRINPGITASNQKENEQYPNRIVHRWAPDYAHWGNNITCGGVL